MTNYFNEYAGTPPLGVDGDYRCSVHYGNTYRLECAKKQAMLATVSIELIINHVIEFLKIIGIEINDSPIKKSSEINYSKIKKQYNLADERDIVWMKFTTDGYLGVIATSNDINFDIPTSSEEYDEKEKVYNSYYKKYQYEWKHNTSGILVHQVDKAWDDTFVLLFPLANIPKEYNRGDIERAVGNYLIDKGVPIIDFYSHNY